MITIYARKKGEALSHLKKWFKKYKYPFIEKNMLVQKLSREELIHIIKLTEQGVTDIISTRGNAYKQMKLNFDEIRLNELIHILQRNPNLLKTPLIVDDKRLQVGYNEDGLRQFVPRINRNISYHVLSNY